jgi:hypothetical protein
MAQKMIDARKAANAAKRAVVVEDDKQYLEEQLDSVDFKKPKLELAMPKVEVDSRPKVNPATWAMCGNNLFLCRQCRAWLAKQCTNKGKDGANYFTMRMCDKCIKLNEEVRVIYREAMF